MTMGWAKNFLFIQPTFLILLFFSFQCLPTALRAFLLLHPSHKRGHFCGRALHPSGYTLKIWRICIALPTLLPERHRGGPESFHCALPHGGWVKNKRGVAGCGRREASFVYKYKSTSADYLAYLGVDEVQRSLAYVFFNDVHFFLFSWLASINVFKMSLQCRNTC